MTNMTKPVFSLSRRPQNGNEQNLLFRAAASRAMHNRALGSPSIAMPPSVFAAVGLAAVLVALIALASWLIEVPQLAKGSGVIMPGDGLIPIAAAAQGHVAEVMVQERQWVKEGDVLIRLSGDATTTGDESHARLQLESLEHELALREQGDEQRQAVSAKRIALIDSRMVALEQQAGSLQRELQARKTTIEIAERRVRRVSQLLVGGGVSPDQLDRVKESAVNAEIAVHGLQNRITQLAADIEAKLTERGGEFTALKLQSLEYAVARERLQRQIQTARLKLSRDVLAPQDSMVSRIRVVPGETVHQGQPLLMLETGDADLEAWLYVATGSGGTVRPGQTIALQIDAFPHQIYGTQSAVVESVSAIALRPAELRVPLAIHGPVFEVRARLLTKEFVTPSNRWPLIAGLSFQADILQSKHRLYQWLLRHVLSPESPAGD